MEFRPGHGYLKVGTDENIVCVLTNSSESVNQEWRLVITDLQDRTDLLSVRDDPIRAQISPPQGSQFYPKHGKTMVRCQYINNLDNQSWASRDLMIHILREFAVQFLLITNSFLM